MKNKLLIVFLIVSVALNLILFYKMFDQSITLDYCQVENRYLGNSLDLLVDLANNLKSLEEKNEIIKKINSEFGNKYIIKADEDRVLYVDNIGIKFVNGKFSKYVLLND